MKRSLPLDKNSKVTVGITGLVFSVYYEKVKECALVLHKENPNLFDVPKFRALGELEWISYSENVQKSCVRKYWETCVPVYVFLNDSFWGDGKCFLEWASSRLLYNTCFPDVVFENRARTGYWEMMENKGYPLVYMDIAVNEKTIGRLLIELYNDVVPETCYNFYCLCKGVADRMTSAKTKFSYKNTFFHRIEKNKWIQGGDIYYGKGNGGEGYTRKFLEDECFDISHSKRGIVSLVNHGRNTGTSQFIILLKPCIWMNKKYTAFGQVIEGEDVLNIMEKVPTGNGQRPMLPVEIMQCGVFHPNSLLPHDNSILPTVRTVLESALDKVVCGL